MSDLDDLYRGGPPSRSELEQWLRQETSAPPAAVEAISAGYAPEDFPTPEDMRGFLAQYSVAEGSERLPPGDPRRTQGRDDDGGRRTGRGPGGGLAEATEQVAAGAAERSRAGRQSTAPAWLPDEGPSVDTGALGTSIAVGVFTDEYGEPILDENGQPTPVNAQTLWESIRGLRFNMGRLAGSFPPRKRTTARVESEVAGGYNLPYKDADRLGTTTRVASEVAGGYGRYKGRTKPRTPSRFLTPSQAMAMLTSMGEDALIGLQTQLLEAGLYGEALPSWGVADDTTRQALMGLFAEASLTPTESVDQVIARLMDEQVRRGAGGEDGTGAGGGADSAVFQPEVTSAETLSGLIDDISQDLLGEFVDPGRKDALIAQLQAREIDTQRQAFGQDVAAQGGPESEIDAFMTAIAGGETTAEAGGGYGTTNQIGAHGRYQIMPANWGPWAERAGLGRNAPQTPQNQEIVARHVMLQYYSQFGNWRDVAIAWFAGPGAVGAAGAENRRDVNGMTVRRYADEAVARMSQLRGAPQPPGALGEMPAIERFDPQAEAEAILRSQDPAAWESHQFGKRAVEFYSLLGGVVGS